jgi:hypothetical protein
MPLTQVSSGMLDTTAQYYSFKNRIINGAMVIDQRNAGASGTSSNAFTVDRWGYFGSQASKGTWQQNAGAVTTPVGFKNYLGFTSSSAYSVLSTDTFSFYQGIEGFNFSDLEFGTANAQTVTLSFWVRSSLTGTFGGSLKNYAGTRSYPFTFTISVANTWEQKTVTIAGDTSGTWVGASANGAAYVNFGLGQGSSYTSAAGAWAAGDFRNATGATSVVGTNGATFYITGVQLEKGSTATSFDYRPYGTELALCQRYCPAWSATAIGDYLPVIASGVTSTVFSGSFTFPVPTRVPVTGITISAASHFTASRLSTGNIVLTNMLFRNPGPNSALLEMYVASGIAVDAPYYLFANNASARIVFNGAEL